MNIFISMCYKLIRKLISYFFTLLCPQFSQLRFISKYRDKCVIFQTSHLIEEIKRFKALEDEIDADHNCLRSLRVDVSSTDAIRKLKGPPFLKEKSLFSIFSCNCCNEHRREFA